MDIKKPQLVKVGAFAYFFEGVLQHPLVCEPVKAISCSRVAMRVAAGHRGIGVATGIDAAIAGGLCRRYWPIPARYCLAGLWCRS